MPGASIQAGAHACYWPLAGQLFIMNAVTPGLLEEPTPE
ncbi:hypothetical protein ABIB73_002403 [Bradyrhizobium sp. F1.4.3]